MDNNLTTTDGFEVSNRVNFENIKLLKSSIEQKPEVRLGKKRYEIEYEADVTTDIDNNGILVSINFNLEIFTDDDEIDFAVATIKANFLLLYRIKDFTDLTDKSFQQFAEDNGVFNAWPYWREYVQSSTVRMGLPPLTIPVYRIKSAPSNLKTENK